MSAISRLEHQFVTRTPRELKPGVLYVSLEYCTMLHMCACGCGRKVVTPLSPNDWNMTFNGKTITVRPSIGSWSLPCQSHYVIKNGKIVWAGQWNDEQIKRGRQADLVRKRGCPAVAEINKPSEQPAEVERKSERPNWLQRTLQWVKDKLQ